MRNSNKTPIGVCEVCRSINLDLFSQKHTLILVWYAVLLWITVASAVRVVVAFVIGLIMCEFADQRFWLP